jgi:uncharacterized membrane protein YciS (DUF1049 family)
MFQPDDKSNIDPQNIGSDPKLDQDDANVSSKNVTARQKNIEGLFFKLIVIGLVVGAILSVGAYFLLTRLGLTKSPDQIEQERIEQQIDPVDGVYNPYLPKSPKG